MTNIENGRPPFIKVLGSKRISFLGPKFLRFEYSPSGAFDDRPTLTVVNRFVGPVSIDEKREGETLVLSSGDVVVRIKDDSSPFSMENLAVEFRVNGEVSSWHPGMEDPANLGGTLRTLDRCDGDLYHGEGRYGRHTQEKLPPGLASRSGWSVVDESTTVPLEHKDGTYWVVPREAGPRQDLYFLAYGHEYKSLLHDAALVFGKQPLPPRYAFGYWWSRYWAYMDWELEQLVDECDRQGIPMDVLVIDMDWHQQGWTGFSWERSYFPDPDEFLRWAKARGLHVSMNLHPADGFAAHEDCYPNVAQLLSLESDGKDTVPFECTDPVLMHAYFKHVLKSYEDQGVEFWWMDWQQGKTCRIPHLDPLPWINHLHWEHLANEYPERRPLSFSRWGGLGSGRYPVGFSGDSFVSWRTLNFLPTFTATANNVLYGYWSHDIGGHYFGESTGELFTRWIQFGIYSPVLRTHATKFTTNDRQFWEMGLPYSRLMKSAVRERYEMVPYIYTEAYKCFTTGVSLCRPMYIEHPEEEAAYDQPQQYYFGSEIIAAPITKPIDEYDGHALQRVWLPEGSWFDRATGTFESGGKQITRGYLLEEIPTFAREGTILPFQGPVTRLNGNGYTHFLLEVVPGKDASYRLFEDDGTSLGYVTDKAAWIDVTYSSAGGKGMLTVRHNSGTFDGFADARRATVRFRAVLPPRLVRVGSADVPWTYRRLEGSTPHWHYNGACHDLIVEVPQFSLKQGLTIEFEIDPAGEAVSVNGLKGVYARLFQAFDAARIVDLPWERQVAFAAQTGNRIARRPLTAAAEIGALRERIETLIADEESVRQKLVKVKADRKMRMDGFTRASALIGRAYALLCEANP